MYTFTKLRDRHIPISRLIVAAVYGTSKDPCSDIYGGPKPFSEPETKALSDFILAHNGTWKVYLTLHSYSQMWMAPYGYTRKKPYNYESLVSSLQVKTATTFFQAHASPHSPKDHRGRC